MLRHVPCIPPLMSFFLIMNRCWILPNAFSMSFKMIMWFLSFLLLVLCITLIDLQILNHPRIPGINPTWSQYMILFIYCWVWFDKYLVRIFSSIRSEIPACNFLLFFFSIFAWFWYQGNGSHKESNQDVPSSVILEIVWEG